MAKKSNKRGQDSSDGNSSKKPSLHEKALKLTKEKFCLSERIRKEIDLSTNETVYCGKITNVTNEISFVEFR